MQSHLQDSSTDRKSKGKILKYIVYGDRSVEHPKKKMPRPRKKPHGSESVQMDPALLTQIQAFLRQKFLINERTTYLEDRIQGLPQPTHFLFQDDSPNSPLEKGSEGVLHAPVIRMHAVGREQKIILEEIRKQI